MFFQSLPRVLIREILQQMELKQLIMGRVICKEWKEDIDNGKWDWDFYMPVFEKIKFVNNTLINRYIWNLVPSGTLYKLLYRSATDLFKRIPDANGCFKFKLSLRELKHPSAGLKIKNTEGIEFMCCRLPFKKQDVESYIDQQLQEYPNPFKSKQVDEENRFVTVYPRP